MRPRGELTSTGYALANPGSEYLVLDPSGDGRPFTVELQAGRYSVEWFAVVGRETEAAGAMTLEADGPVEFKAPSSGPSVLYLGERPAEANRHQAQDRVRARLDGDPRKARISGAS